MQLGTLEVALESSDFPVASNLPGGKKTSLRFQLVNTAWADLYPDLWQENFYLDLDYSRETDDVPDVSREEHNIDFL